MSSARSSTKTLVWLLLAGALAWCVLRSLWLPDRLWDYRIYYVSTRAWLEGRDPYDQAELNRRWVESGGASLISDRYMDAPAVAPPIALVVAAPLGWLSPQASAVAWLAMCVLFVIAQIAATDALAGLRPAEPRGLLLAAATLALAPLPWGMLAGQPAVPSAAMIVIAVWAASRRRDLLAGVLLGLASAWKVQLGLPFVALYLLVHRRWRVGGVALLTVALLAGIGFWRVSLTHTDWLAHWSANLHDANDATGLNDFSLQNKVRHHLVNLQLIVAAFTDNRSAAQAVSLLVTAVIALALLALVWSRRDGEGRPDELLCSAIVAPLTLLPVYHRYYDAVILALTLAWVMREITPSPLDALRRWRTHGVPWLVALLMVNFLTPVSLTFRLAEHLPPAFTHSIVWNAFVVPHRAWSLLVMALALLHAAARPQARPRGLPTHSGSLEALPA